MLSVCDLDVLQIIAYIREEIKRNNISEQTIIGLIWFSVMSSVEWNKKEELVTEQAIKLLKVTHPVIFVDLLSKCAWVIVVMTTCSPNGSSTSAVTVTTVLLPTLNMELLTKNILLLTCCVNFQTFLNEENKME